MKKGIILGFILVIIALLLGLFLVNCSTKKYVTFENVYGEDFKLKINDGQIEKPESPKREGYRFIGWFLDNEIFDFDREIDENITLTAKFEKIEETTYRVIFDSDGGSLVDAQNVIEDEKATKPINPTKEGYTFDGWYSADKLYSFNSIVTNDLNLKAKWSKIEESEETNASGQETVVTKPAVTKPSVSKPTVSEPEVTKPEESKPDETKPDETKPEEVKDTENPSIENFEIVESSNKLTVTLTGKDNTSATSNLKYEYSLDDINYQTSNVFENLAHNTSYTVYVKITDEANNSVTNSKTVKTLKITTPANETLSTEDITNQDITVTINNSDDYNLQYSLDGITYYTATNNSVDIESNGMVYFRYTDMDSNYSDIYSINITNIDKIAPVITNSTCTATVSTITCEVEATDDTDITYYYSIDDTNYSETDKIENLESNTEYDVYIKLVDEAGNTTKVNKNVKTLSIKDFDGEIEIHETMNKNPLIVAKNIDEDMQLQYSFNKTDFYNYTDDVESTYDNSKVYFRYKDGNYTSENLVEEEIERKLNVLIVGNSFSGNTLYEMKDIAMYYGLKPENLEVGYLFKGGQSIDNHLNDYRLNSNNYTYYNLNQANGNYTKNENVTFTDTIKRNDWEYIIFQQNSTNSGLANTYDNLDELIDVVDSLKTNDYVKYGFNMTWAYQADNISSPFLTTYNGDQAFMYNSIIDAVQEKVETNDRIEFIIPGGTAIQNGRTSNMGDNFANLLSNNTPDTHITTDHGQTLLGLTFFGKLTGIDISNFDYDANIGDIPYHYYYLIAESANNALMHPYEVTNSTDTYVPNYNEDGIDLNYFEEFTISDYTLHKTWNSASVLPTADLSKTYSYEEYIALPIITKEDLPVGSIIKIKPSTSVRFDGWVSETQKTPSLSRPSIISSTSTATKTIVVTDEWWGDYTIRGINMSRFYKEDLTVDLADELLTRLKIYVPKAS